MTLTQGNRTTQVFGVEANADVRLALAVPLAVFDDGALRKLRQLAIADREPEHG